MSYNNPNVLMSLEMDLALELGPFFHATIHPEALFLCEAPHNTPIILGKL